jgi:hypothetical protein
MYPDAHPRDAACVKAAVDAAMVKVSEVVAAAGKAPRKWKALNCRLVPAGRRAGISRRDHADHRTLPLVADMNWLERHATARITASGGPEG